jgi:pimeloyl-ACP methyl ester carboxylesterase
MRLTCAGGDAALRIPHDADLPSPFALEGTRTRVSANIREHSRVTGASEHFWTASDGVRLAYHELGEGRPVVLLHGLFSDAETNWIKFGTAARIAAEGFRVIMPDLRAHGQSDKPHGREYYPKGIIARDLRELIDRLGLTEFDLGGFSLGARTTVEAVGEGMRPRRAVLGGAGLEGLRNWKRRKTFFVEAIGLFDTVKRGDPHWLSIQFMKSQGVDRVAAAQLLDSFEDAFVGWLQAFTMPTLVVCGSEDDDNGSAEELANVLPHAVFVEVPGTHMSSVTKPQFGEAIAGFLAA